MNPDYYMRRLYLSAIGIFLLSMLATTSLTYSQENEAAQLDHSQTRDSDKIHADMKESEPVNKTKLLGFDIGFGGGYTSGASVSNFYYKPYGNIYLKHKYVKFAAGLSRFQNYLITNGEGKFEKVNFTQPRVALSLYPHKIIELYGEYRFSTGDDSHYYRGHDVTAGFLLDFDKVVIDSSFNKRITEYEFKSVDWPQKITLLYSDINNHGRVTQFYSIDINDIKYLDDMSATVNLTWNVIDSTGVDATYFYLYTTFKYPGDSYYVHTGRLGFFSDVWKYISVHGGASLGIDREKYIITGGDIGMTFNILGYVTLSATYLPSYFIAPKTNRALDRFMELYVLYVYNYNITGTSNPYLQTSLIGKSFLNHCFNFFVTCKY